MLASDIREMSEADINARIAELERERFNLRLASGTRTLDDPLRLRVIRRDVARLKTVLREKVIGVAEVGSGSRERRSEKETGDYLNRLNTALLTKLQDEGIVYLSNAVIDSVFALRACVVNFRTTSKDIATLVDATLQAGSVLDAEMRRAQSSVLSRELPTQFSAEVFSRSSQCSVYSQLQLNH